MANIQLEIVFCNINMSNIMYLCYKNKNNQDFMWVLTCRNNSKNVMLTVLS